MGNRPSQARGSRGTTPRLLIINQYFASREATGQLLKELGNELADQFDITVASAPPTASGGDNEPVDPRIRVLHVPASRFGRASLVLRALNYLTFLARLPVVALRAGRPDVILCFTDPPLVGLVALLVARLRSVPFVLGCQDVHPQLGQVSGRLTNPVVVAVLRAGQLALLRNATRVIALGEAMRDRLESLGATSWSVVVIPNWTDLSLIRPLPRENAWRRQAGLDGRFVVMHAGNIGQLQNLDVVLEASALLPDVTFVVVGDGSGRAALLERVQCEERANVLLLPWQERELLAEVLASADAHLVSLVPGIGGLLEPSKLYGALASGRPVIAALDPCSEGGRIVRGHECGVHVPPGDAQALASAVELLASLPRSELVEMGARARAFAEAHADRRQAAAAYARVLSGVTGGP